MIILTRFSTIPLLFFCLLYVRRWCLVIIPIRGCPLRVAYQSVFDDYNVLLSFVELNRRGTMAVYIPQGPDLFFED